jgi:hypothetical protein
VAPERSARVGESSPRRGRYLVSELNAHRARTVSASCNVHGIWRLRRRETGEAAGGGAAAVTERPKNPPVEDHGQSLEELRERIESLTDANRLTPQRATERELLALRHLAGIRLVDEPAAEPTFADPGDGELPAGDPLPEIAGDELSGSLLRAGILRDGCLLVRGLVPRTAALALAEQIDRAFAERERYESGAAAAEGYYEEFEPHERYGSVFGRSWIQQGGGVLAADAPTLHFTMMELFRAASLPRIASDYLGEPALISVHKTTLRKADPSVPGAWHQDGYFMGPVRSLNLWLSLSRCGDLSPGLDIVPTRLEHYVATATDEAKLDYTISQQKAEEAAGDHGIVRPIFEPGDALFFDELFLHQTGSSPEMPNPRYAIENWFFGGSAFPEEYAPIAV